MTTLIGTLAFFALAAMAVAGGAFVAFSRNIVHSAFALLGTFLGVAGLYAMLSADFVAIIQVLVYVGGILILILFAVMLTSRIAEANVSNQSISFVPGLFILAAVAGLIAYVALTVNWPTRLHTPPVPTTAGIGDALLSTYVLPFEAVSVLLFAALLGAVTLARGREKKDASEENESRRGAA